MTDAPLPPPGCPAHRADLPLLLGPEYQADPIGWFEDVRAEQGSVALVRLPGSDEDQELTAWLTLGYNATLRAAQNSTSFTCDTRRWRLAQEGHVAPGSIMNAATQWVPIAPFFDGPEHQRLRAPLLEGLEKFDKVPVRRWVRRFAREEIARFYADGRADLVEQYAWRLPMLVMTQLLGMPDDYGPPLVHAVRDMLSPSPTADESRGYVMGLCQELAEKKRAEGATGQDLASWMLSHPSQLTDTEVAQHLWFVLVSANETTANLIANTLALLCTDDETRKNFQGGQLTIEEAVFQALWDSPPVSLVPRRIATGNTVLGDKEIRQGDMVMLGLLPANWDPQVRGGADGTADVFRNRNNSHLAFGGGGNPHECPGQGVGMRIAMEAVAAALDLLPRVRVPEGAPRTLVPGMVSVRLQELPAVWRPNPQMLAELTSQAAPRSAAPAQPAAAATQQAAASSTQAAAQTTAPAQPAEEAVDSGWRRFLRAILRR